MSDPLKRAQVAEELVAMHPAALECARAETVTHLLSDLMHHCAATRLDFEGSLAKARELHRDELLTHCYLAD